MKLLRFGRARRGLGYIEDKPSRYDLPAKFSTARVATPDVVSHRAHWPFPWNQGLANSCVGHAVATAMHVRERILGLRLPPPSRHAIYYAARKQTLKSIGRADAKVSDDGAYIRDAMRALSKLGAPGEPECPYSDGWLKINRPTPFGALITGHARSGGEYRRILSYGGDRLREIEQALAAGLPVVFGTAVGESFMDDGGPEIIGPPTHEPEVGLHAMCVLGYDRTYGSGTVYQVANSWGSDWREGGYALFTADYLAWERTRDLWVVDGWQAIRRAS